MSDERIKGMTKADVQNIIEAYKRSGQRIVDRYTPVFQAIKRAFQQLVPEVKRVVVTMNQFFTREQIEDYMRIGRYGTSPNFDPHDCTWVCDMCSAWLHESCTDRELCCCRHCVRAKLNTSHKIRRA